MSHSHTLRKFKQTLNGAVAAACLCATALSGSPAFAAEGKIQTVASFSILGDLVRQIGGSRVEVDTLIGANEDAHGFSARPSDAKKVAKADLVFANGLGFDSWIERLVESTQHKQPIVVVSDSIIAMSGGHHHHHHDGHEHQGEEHEHAEHHHHDDAAADHDHHSGQDPHAWQNPRHVKTYVKNIAKALSAADPAGEAFYHKNMKEYIKKLNTLSADIKKMLADIPAERRRVVTSHDAFAYFAEAFKVEFISAAGISHEAEPSAAALAQLIEQIKTEKVQVVFVENISDPRMAEQIRNETGAHMGGTLYSDALSAEDGPASSYLSMMRFNAEQLHKALAH